jgi:sulfate transport system substrate-binding protein
VHLVRKGNPNGIKDCDDLVKPGVGVITPNPKTSGGARWNYRAAWGFALKKFGNNPARAEAFVAVKELGPTRFDIVVPSLSIMAEPPVTVVDRNVDRKGTRAVATAYLAFLYTSQGQTIDEVFGGWSKAQPAHFNDGGVFDRIFTRK